MGRHVLAILSVVLLVGAAGCSSNQVAADLGAAGHESAPCGGVANACTEQGQSRCSGDQSAVETCQQGATGCWSWTQTKVCTAGSPCDKASVTCPGCTPSCAGKECGPDQCGGSCAPGCSSGKSCNTQSGRCEAVTSAAACPVPTVTACAQLGDSAAQAKGCCQADGVAVFCDGGGLVSTNCKLLKTTCDAVSKWSMNYCVPTNGAACSDVVAPKTTGTKLSYPTINVNWSMACWNDDKPTDRSLFVFVEDTATDDTALRFSIYVDSAGAPKVGTTYDLAQFSALARPLFVSLLSGVKFDEGGTYDKEYLVYSGKVTFQQLNSGSAVGSQLKVVFDELWAREIVPGKSCVDVVNGARMYIKHLSLELKIGALHVDQDCKDWAGG